MSPDRDAALSRPRGRPRSAQIDRAILDAAIDLLAEVGLSGLTIEGIAARAGVSRPSVYRRWTSKSELAAAAVRVLAEQLPVPDTGNTRKDLIQVVEGVTQVLTTSRGGGVERNLLPEIPRNPELRRGMHATLQWRRAAVVEVLRRGVERGELRPDVDLAMVFDLLVAPVHFRFLLESGPLNRAFHEEIVDLALEGLAPPRRRARPRRRVNT